MQHLTSDELLSTTRAVRRRLDLERPVPRALLEECIALALQAPSASNGQPWTFVVVDDQATKDAIAAWYLKSYDAYAAAREATGDLSPAMRRMADSARYLADRFGQVPAMVIPCVQGRLERRPADGQAAGWGSIVQAGWSFCLAARARGLGTCWTTLHLTYEREVAEILGIPHDEVTQSCLLTVGYATGGDFKPAPRGPVDDVIRWDRW
ncbi:MAG: nitroreductase family protein [Gaiellales bacterium]